MNRFLSSQSLLLLVSIGLIENLKVALGMNFCYFLYFYIRMAVTQDWQGEEDAFIFILGCQTSLVNLIIIWILKGFQLKRKENIIDALVVNVILNL